jgi:tetratricopeptide (TPR) repeat protein
MRSLLLVGLSISIATAGGAIALAATTAPGGQQQLIAATTEARNAYATRNFGVAQQKYEEAVKLAASAAPRVRIVLLSNLGAAYREDHKYDRAEETFKKALAISTVNNLDSDQSSRLMMQQYAALLRKQNRNHEADTIEMRASLGTPAQAAVAAGTGFTRRARPTAPVVVKAPEPTSIKAPNWDELEKMTSAEEVRKLAEKHPKEGSIWAYLGTLEAKSEKWKLAAEAFKRALEIDPKHEGLHGWLAYSLLKSDQPQEALEHCKKAVEADPEDGDAYRLLSAAYSQTGDVAAQLEVDEKFLEKFPNHQDHPKVSQSVIALKRDVETTRQLEKNTSNKPTDTELNRSWIKAQMPLKVYIKDRDDDLIKLEADESSLITENTPGELITRAMNAWGEASQGRVQFQMTSRYEESNITVEFTDDPQGLENEWAAGITGWNHDDPARPKAQIRLLYVKRSTGEPIDRARFYETVLHEFGHALGLNHSNRVDDVMYRAGRVNKVVQLSDNDRDRLVKLYTAL